MNLGWHTRYSLIRIAVWLLRLSGWYERYWNYCRHTFAYAARTGLHILSANYYSPIPDTSDRPDELWSRPRFSGGLHLRIEAALAWLGQLKARHGLEFNTLGKESTNRQRFNLKNAAFTCRDAEILYATVRDLKHRRIVEIGSGNSTLLTCESIRANFTETSNCRCEFTTIDPFPSAISLNTELEIIMPLHAMWKLHRDVLRKTVHRLTLPCMNRPRFGFGGETRPMQIEHEPSLRFRCKLCELKSWLDGVSP